MPSTAAPASGYPVILAIHGGGWHKYSKEQFSPAVEPLTSEGFAVVAVNYQLATSRAPSWPMALTDLWQSVGWINRQSANYRLNPQQITALGTSAGGNLAMLLATGAGTPFASTSSAASPQNLPKIQAAVSFFGPTELESCSADSRRGAGIAITRFLGGSVTELPDLYQAASPLNHVSKTTAPILLIHGTADDLIPVSQSEKMADALSKAGVMNQLIEVPGGIHAQIG
ncbi:MAG: alpha/beta hydrolase fold domain-containing protein, partial [bacterium]